MAYYHRMGEIPKKRHTQFKQKDGSLYKEELVSSRGFSGVYTNMYHIFSPTNVKEVLPSIPYSFEILKEYGLKHTHLTTTHFTSDKSDYLEGRIPLLANKDVTMSLCTPKENMDYFYKNADGDELIFVHNGSGKVISQFGILNFQEGDYIVIPRTTIYQMQFDSASTRLLIIDSKAPIETVKRYRNELGQLMEHSPYCERDIHPPQTLHTEQTPKDTLVKIKKEGFLHQYVYAFSPLDVIGWDGYLYPYTLSIYDFEPITGRIHQPPPVHQTFQAQNAFVICSFVPRLFDYHPEAIPAPYNHSNIDSDEVLYYVEGNFMSRKGIDTGSITLHPGGLPHGPHPGTAEASIGAKETKEYAVMLDTFAPLYLTSEAYKYIDKNYPSSWTTPVG